jgi:hypothetical protein
VNRQHETGARNAPLYSDALWGALSLLGGACLALAPAYVENAAPRASFLAIVGLLLLSAYAWRIRGWPFLVINAVSIYQWFQLI